MPEFPRHIARNPLFRRGLQLYQQEQFFEAHEVWEDLWRELPDPERRLVRAYIQIAAGFLKLRKGRPIGARALWGRAMQNLEPFTQIPEIARLRDQLADLRRRLQDGNLPQDSSAPSLPS